MALRGPQARLRSLDAEIERRTSADHLLDHGVSIQVVRQDIDHGVAVAPGKPPVTAVGDPISVGGMWDCRRRRFVGESIDPVTWYVGEYHARILLAELEKPFDSKPDGASRTLLYSAEGGGKTFLLAQWLVLQVIRMASAGVSGYGGATAPVGNRLQFLVKALKAQSPIDTPLDRRPGSWGRYFVTPTVREIRFRCGVTLQLRATKRQSESTGSPIQGATWHFSGDDELQDTAANGADPDIEMRLRGARFPRRMATATAKDSSDWRTFRDKKQESPDWVIERIPFDATPFVWPDFWEAAKRNTSTRDWQRRGLALDVAPENQVYWGFDRSKHVQPVPQVGARDATERALSRVPGARWAILCGYDPGAVQHVALLLRCFLLGRDPEPCWWVVDELVKRKVGPAAFAEHVRDYVRQHHRIETGALEDGRLLTHADKWTDSGKDEKDVDRSAYTAWKNSGLWIRPAQYAKAIPGKPPRPGSIPMEASIDMINRLFSPQSGKPRLFIAEKDGSPVAPALVNSLEQCERDAWGKAHSKPKDKRADLSDPPAALRNGLWHFEKIRMREAA